MRNDSIELLQQQQPFQWQKKMLEASRDDLDQRSADMIDDKQQISNPIIDLEVDFKDAKRIAQEL